MSKPLDDPEATPEDVLHALLHPPAGREDEAKEKLAVIDTAATAGHKSVALRLVENGDIDRSEVRDYDFLDVKEKNATRLFVIAAFQSLYHSVAGD